MPDKLFFAYNHQRKADSYILALKRAGWQETKDPSRGRFVLTDYMVSRDVSRRSNNLELLRAKGIRIFIYPHAARPNIFWDFPGQDFPRGSDCHFVAARGHVEIMRAYGYPLPIETVGWSLCNMRRYKWRPVAEKILFGPIHPNSNGYLSELDKSINRDAFRALLLYSQRDGVEITVRYIGSLKENGLHKAGGVRYIEGSKDLSTGEIDRADLVVSHQTFAYLAVARGVPTLMMGESHPPRWGGKDEELRIVSSWDRYRDLLRYPLDILDGSPSELIRCAISSDKDIAEWRERLIGKPFDEDRFVKVLEGYL